jgi:hypothetical protein
MKFAWNQTGGKCLLFISTEKTSKIFLNNNNIHVQFLSGGCLPLVDISDRKWIQHSAIVELRVLEFSVDGRLSASIGSSMLNRSIYFLWYVVLKLLSNCEYKDLLKKVKGRFIGPSSAPQPYRPIVPLAPMSSLIHLQRGHVPKRHERPQPAKEGTIQGILLAHS